jgi:hypothetical protein
MISPRTTREGRLRTCENLNGKQGISEFWWRCVMNNQMKYEFVKENDDPVL